MSFDAHVSEHRRLAVLRWLEAQGEHTSNESIVASTLGRLGIPSTRDQVRAEIAWLEEQGLVTVETAFGLMVPTATERGLDVAAGRARHPGVQRPAPKPKG